MSYSNPMHHSTPDDDYRPFWRCPDCGREYDDIDDGPCPSDDCPSRDCEDDENAAPDLLAALRALLPHVPGYQSGDSAGRPWLDQALAAIAKVAP